MSSYIYTFEKSIDTFEKSIAKPYDTFEKSIAKPYYTFRKSILFSKVCMKYNIIVAMCKYNNGIGCNGSLPWVIKEDLQHFSKLTKGRGKNAVIMGSNTYKSLNRPGLLGRDNFILSSSLKLDFVLQNENISSIVTPSHDARAQQLLPKKADTADTISVHRCKTFTNITSLLETCTANNYDTVWIIGGGSIYRQFIKMNIISKCYVTLIHKLFICDTTFPLLSLYDWTIEKVDEVISDNYDFKIEFMVYTIINHNVDYQ